MIHRFFDTSPFSPSGRYLGLTRLAAEDRLPQPGDVAEIVVVDLASGDHQVVAETRAWDTQLGAQVQWGGDDSQLFFNELDTRTWRAYGVRLDPLSGAREHLEGTVYAMSSDGARAASPCLLRIRAVQAGYGIIAPAGRVPENRGAPADDGVRLTDTVTGASRLLVSFRDLLDALGSRLSYGDPDSGGFYGFHVRWNLQDDRLQFVLCWVDRHAVPRARVQRQLVTMRADGSDVHLAIPASEWRRGGHHPSWCPDGVHVMMNLRLDGGSMRFVRARHDGGPIVPLAKGIVGSGHPTMHPHGRHVLTDAYPFEPVALDDRTVPLRLISLEDQRERTLLRVPVMPPYRGPRNELRVDPHPAWDRSFQRIAFNACPDGTRRVYVADLSETIR